MLPEQAGPLGDHCPPEQPIGWSPLQLVAPTVQPASLLPEPDPLLSDALDARDVDPLADDAPLVARDDDSLREDAGALPSAVVPPSAPPTSPPRFAQAEVSPTSAARAA